MHHILAGFAFIALTGTAGASPPKPDPAKLGWHTDYATAKAEARRAGKPILLVFRCEP